MRSGFTVVYLRSQQLGRSVVPREGGLSDSVVGYLQRDDMRLLLVQVGQPLRMLFPEQVTSDPGL